MALLASEDVAIRAVAVKGDLGDRYRKAANMLRVNWPVTLMRANMRLIDKESRDWEGLASQDHWTTDLRGDPNGIC